MPDKKEKGKSPWSKLRARMAKQGKEDQSSNEQRPPIPRTVTMQTQTPGPSARPPNVAARASTVPHRSIADLSKEELAAADRYLENATQLTSQGLPLSQCLIPRPASGISFHDAYHGFIASRSKHELYTSGREQAPRASGKMERIAESMGLPAPGYVHFPITTEGVRMLQNKATRDWGILDELLAQHKQTQANIQSAQALNPGPRSSAPRDAGPGRLRAERAAENPHPRMFGAPHSEDLSVAQVAHALTHACAPEKPLPPLPTVTKRPLSPEPTLRASINQLLAELVSDGELSSAFSTPPSLPLSALDCATAFDIPLQDLDRPFLGDDDEFLHAYPAFVELLDDGGVRLVRELNLLKEMGGMADGEYEGSMEQERELAELLETIL